MSDYMFGMGAGWLPRKAAAIARQHGADQVNYTDPQCRCGHGCRAGECRAARRHWFTVRNLGEPFNSRTAQAVLADLRVVGVPITQYDPDSHGAEDYRSLAGEVIKQEKAVAERSKHGTAKA